MKDKVKCVVLQVKREGILPSFDAEIFDRSLDAWVCESMRNFQVESVLCEDDENILPLVQPLVSTDKEITVVLFSDTPLISNASVSEAIAQLVHENSDMLKMPRGYVFKSEYLAGLEQLPNIETSYFSDDDYVMVYNNNQLAYVTDILRSRISLYFMGKGVRLLDPSSTYIGCDVVIESNVTIEPFSVIKGRSVIKSGATIGSHCEIDGSVVSSGAVVRRSVVTKSVVGEGCTVGPFAHLREQTVLYKDVHIGNYVEVKNSKIGCGTKIGHLAYVGDATVGERCNIGAGVVFANYDGEKKNGTVVGNNVFIGSNSTVVSPLTLGDNAFIAGGSVITESVEGDALAVARARQVVKNDWKRNPYNKDKRS